MGSAVWPHRDSIPSLGSQFLDLCICVLNGQGRGESQLCGFCRGLRKLNVDLGMDMDTVGGKGHQTAGGGVRFQGWGAEG